MRCCSLCAPCRRWPQPWTPGQQPLAPCVQVRPRHSDLFLSVGTASARLALHQQTLTQGCWRSTQLQWGWCMAGCVCTVPKASLAREGEWSWPAAALWHPKAHRVQAGPWAHTPADPSINRGEAERGSSATRCPDGPTNAVESILDGDETRASTRRLCYRH